MSTSIVETLRRFRGTPADEAAGVVVFVALILTSGFFGRWGMVYAIAVCAFVCLALVGSLIRQAVRAGKSEVRHV